MLKGGYSAGIWLLLEDKPCVSLPVKQRWIQAAQGKRSQRPGVLESDRKISEKVVCFQRKLKYYEKIRGWSCRN